MRSIAPAALMISATAISACGSPPASTTTAGIRADGVYAKFPDGLRGIQSYSSTGPGGGLNRPEPMIEGRAAGIRGEGTPEYFVVNLPDVEIADSKVYWFDAPDALVRAQNAWGFETPEPLASSIEDLGSHVYKVFAPAVAGRAAERRRNATTNDIGCAALVLRISPNARTADGPSIGPVTYVDLVGPRPPSERMYCVSITRTP
jgi:hypothetical protein